MIGPRRRGRVRAARGPRGGGRGGLRARRRARLPVRPRRHGERASRRASRSSSPASASTISSVPSPARYQTVNAGLAVAACRLLLGRSRRPARRAGRWRPRRCRDACRSPAASRCCWPTAPTTPTAWPLWPRRWPALDRPAPRVGVFAIMADKAVDEMLAALVPLVDTVVCTQASEARSLTAAPACRARRRAPRARRCPRRRPHRAVTRSPTRTPRWLWPGAWPAAAARCWWPVRSTCSPTSPTCSRGEAGSGGVY